MSYGYRDDSQLGDVWSWINNAAEDVLKVAGTVRATAPKVQGVIEGRDSIVTVPKGQAAFVSGTGTVLGTSFPAWLVPTLLAGGAYLLWRRR